MHGLQARCHGSVWRADDRYVAYPLWEKCQKLGVTSVQFHKGLPFGRQLLEHQRPNDIEQAAIDFPDLTFIIHHLGMPFIDDTIKKAQQEYDTEKRRALVHSMDKYLGQKMYAVNGLGGASGFSFAWPTVQNYRAYRGGSANTNRVENMYWWLDDTKAPLK